MRQSLTTMSLLSLLCLAAIGCTIGVSHVVDVPTSAVVTAAVTSASHHAETVDPPTSTPEPSNTPIPSATSTPSTPSLTPTPSPSSTSTGIPPLVAIDAGHGGKDLGARHFDANGRMDFNEAQVNLDIALRLRDQLVQRGYRVLLTRDGDYQLHKTGEDYNGDGQIEYVVDECQARVDMINEAGADLLLSIHQNAYEGKGAGEVGGTMVYYCAHRDFSDRNLRFAELVHGALVEAFEQIGYDIRDRGVRVDVELTTSDHPGHHLILLGPQAERIVRPSQMPGALSETLFITHHREAEIARDPATLDALAAAYADAICAYFQEFPATPRAP